MVVDRRARASAAQLLRDFISGKVTNFEFEERCPETHDRAIQAVWDTAWLFYDDFKTHRLTGRHALDVTIRRMIVRWVVFLHSDLEYKWPHLHQPGADPNTRVEQSALRRLISPFRLKRTEANKFLNAGHYPVWPFVSVKDYKAAISRPRLLSRAA